MRPDGIGIEVGVGIGIVIVTVTLTLTLTLTLMLMLMLMLTPPVTPASCAGCRFRKLQIPPRWTSRVVSAAVR